MAKFETKGDCSIFHHDDLMEISSTALNELLVQDTFLCDLPKGVILEEVNNQIALQHGKSITIYVIREDEEKLPVIVPHVESTVADLKKSIQKYISIKVNRSRKKKSRQKLISWKYFWRTHQLKHNETLLDDNNAKLSKLGLKNKSYVEFVKKRRKKLY